MPVVHAKQWAKQVCTAQITQPKPINQTLFLTLHMSETALWKFLLLFPGFGNANKKWMELGF